MKSYGLLLIAALMWFTAAAGFASENYISALLLVGAGLIFLAFAAHLRDVERSEYTEYLQSAHNISGVELLQRIHDLTLDDDKSPQVWVGYRQALYDVRKILDTQMKEESNE